MTRKQKINYIKNELPYLYEKLSEDVPTLIKTPYQASEKDISKYNNIVFDYVFRFFDFPLIKKLSF